MQLLGELYDLLHRGAGMTNPQLADLFQSWHDGELADYDQHPGDQGTETFEQELDETTDLILEEEERRVKEAQRALAEGKYGVCIVCGKEIPPERLDAIPETVRCIEHQREHDTGRGVSPRT